MFEKKKIKKYYYILSYFYIKVKDKFHNLIFFTII